jgi:hypothetical protein
MKFIILSFCISLSNFTLSQSHKIKCKHYKLEFGSSYTSIYFLSSKTKNYFYNYYTNYFNTIFIPTSYYVKGNINKNNQIKLTYMQYGIFPSNQTDFPVITQIDFRSIDLSLNRKITEVRKLNIYASGNISKRWGQEVLLLGYYNSSGFSRISDFSKYKSIGIGLGADLSYKICKKFLIGLDLQYVHYFEKPNLSNNLDSELFKDYKPIKDIVKCDIKVGVQLF